MTRSVLLLTLCFAFADCNHKQPGNELTRQEKIQVGTSVRYARGFTIAGDGKITRITIKNPWQNADRVEYTCLLSDTIPSSVIIDESHCLLKTPVKRVVCLSTTHIGFIEYLNESQTIVGISGKDYVVNEGLRTKIRNDQLPDVGYDENLNYELILKLRPDVVLAYGVSGTVTNTLRKLNELGIPTLIIAEYLEEEPLAKMEWVKVFGLLFDREFFATQRFDSVADQYNELRLLADKVRKKPTVLLGLPWHGTWYISGGQSYVARLVADAGGEYIFNHYKFSDSRPVALEKVFEEAMDADFWLNSGDALNRKDIFSVDERFDHLHAIRYDQVYNNNKRLGPNGGNDFFESGVVEPQIILADLIYILHPQLLPSHQLKYYRKLQ